MDEWISAHGNMGVVIDAPLILIAVSARGLEDSEWDAFLDINPSTTKAKDAPRITASLSYSTSVGLSATQRKRLADRSQASRVATFNAVVTDSIVVRGGITALSWIMPGRITFRAFPCSEVLDALAWLATKEPRIDVQRARIALRSLLRKVDSGGVAAAG